VELLSRLRTWYVRVQKKHSFSLFRDSELVALAEARPNSRDELAALLPISKVEQHGDELLAMLKDQDAGRARSTQNAATSARVVYRL